MEEDRRSGGEGRRRGSEVRGRWMSHTLVGAAVAWTNVSP